MKTYKAVILDDEPIAIDVLRHHLDLFEEFEVVESFQSPHDAIKYLQNNKVDLLISDIGLPGISGLDIVRLLGGEVPIILTTSYSEYAIESFDLNVVDYLLKPISVERFKRALDRFETYVAKEGTAIEEPSFYVKDGEDYSQVLVKEIDYIEGGGDYVKIFCGRRFHMILKTLKAMEDYLAPYGFQRVHKSYVVPRSKIKQYNGRCLLINDKEIPVGASYRSAIRAYVEKNRL